MTQGNTQVGNKVCVYRYAKIMFLIKTQQLCNDVGFYLTLQYTTSSGGVVVKNTNYVMMFLQDVKKEYMEKKEKGELAAQKVDFLKQNILRPVKKSLIKSNINNNNITMMMGIVMMMMFVHVCR